MAAAAILEKFEMVISPQQLTIYLYSASRGHLCYSTAFLFGVLSVCQTKVSSCALFLSFCKNDFKSRQISQNLCTSAGEMYFDDVTNGLKMIMVLV